MIKKKGNFSNYLRESSLVGPVAAAAGGGGGD